MLPCQSSHVAQGQNRGAQYLVEVFWRLFLLEIVSTVEEIKRGLRLMVV